jgi:hypothetical protein
MENPQTAKDVAAAERRGQHNQWGGHKGSGSSASAGSTASAPGGKGTGWMGGHQTWGGYGDEWSAEAKKRRAAGDEAGAKEAEKAAQHWYDKEKKPKSPEKKPKQDAPAESSDPTSIGPDIGMPDTSVPGTTWGPTSSTSGGTGNVVGFFKRNGKTIPITA